MSNPSIPERLATLESEMSAARSDLTTIKGDVKTLLMSGARGTGAIDLLSRAVPWLALVVAAAAVVIHA